MDRRAEVDTTKSILVFILTFILVFTPNVHATSLKSFSDGETEKVLIYTASGNQTVYIVLPKVSTVTNASMVVEGNFSITNWIPNSSLVEELELLAFL